MSRGVRWPCLNRCSHRYVANGIALIWPRAPRTTARVAGADGVAGFMTSDRVHGVERESRAADVLDATDNGDRLPLAGIEAVTGAGARTETSEPSAPETAAPLYIQAFAFKFVMDPSFWRKVWVSTTSFRAPPTTIWEELPASAADSLTRTPARLGRLETPHDGAHALPN